MQEHEDDANVELPSSDDDPRLGQVTPHRLLSPRMRRLDDDDTELGSDDSIPSPSKDLVRRRSSVAVV
jgi:hypothetical protein